MFKHRLVTSSAVLAVLASAITIAPATAASGGTRQISAGGLTTIQSTAPGNGALEQPETRAGTDGAVNSSGAASVPALNGPNRSRSEEQAGGSGGSGEDRGDRSGGQLAVVTSFDGLNHRQQRLANHGNQFSIEPPDQGLCVGNGFVMETVNDVMNVYNTSGQSLLGFAQDLNTFYGYIPQVIRIPRQVGPFVTDPSCLFDKDTQRWFHVALTLEVKRFPPHAGAFLGPNHLDLAVSRTSSPLGAWTIYRLPVQDDGTAGTPDHGCSADADANGNPVGHGPCLGDFPHIGADANGIYVTTNEYSFFGPEFHGAQVYAFSKRALASGASSVGVTQIDTHGMDNGNSGFTLWPATAPGAQETAAGGTEYFLSSNAADEAHGNGSTVGPRMSRQLLVWALTNTASLGSDEPEVALSHDVLGVGLYAFPPPSNQKAGDFPQGQCLNDVPCATNFLLGGPDPFAPNAEYALDSSDTRMMQVTFANGKLWGALDTALKVHGDVKAGIEWFVVQPSVGDEGSVRGSVVRQGYLGLANNNLIYPAIGVTASGQGVMAFTVVGADFYPSAGFAAIDSRGVGQVQIAKAGLGPSDGFTGYPVQVGGVARPRWGDYGAAVPDGNSVWIASEYIGQTCDLATYLATGGSCGGTRTVLANWDTRISQIQLGDRNG